MPFSFPEAKQLYELIQHRNLEFHLHNLTSYYQSRVTLLLSTEGKGEGAGETRPLRQIVTGNEGQAA